MEYRRVFIIMILWISVLLQGAGALAKPLPSIGNVTAVQGQVEVIRSGESAVSMVKLGESVRLDVLYETKTQDRLKLLLEDDSILSLGENTSLEIEESIYHPEKNQRSTVIEMVDGSVRALIGKTFDGPGSKFEIHTLTAAAAGGTYFIVWISKEGEKNSTGVVNIGETGKVVVSNIDPAVKGLVALGRNQYTMVEDDKPPTPASGINAGMLNDLIGSTDVQDQIIEEIPKGTEAPGSDVSHISATSFPSLQAATRELGRQFIPPAVPPIMQQPENGAPISVNGKFP